MKRCDGAYKELKPCDCHYRLASAQAENERLRGALIACVGWVEPVMDGFRVPKDSAGYQVLTNAKAALERSDKPERSDTLEGKL